jgi:hypothetical protein
MRTEIAKLLRNLGAGMRLAFFAPVSRLAFRIDVAQLLLLFGLSALIDMGSDWIRYGPDAYFSWFGFGSEVFAAGLTMVSAAILALAFRQPALTVAIPVLVLSGYPLIQLAHVALAAALRWGTPTNTVATAFDWLIVAWAVALFTRAVAVALAPTGSNRWGRAIAGGLLLVSPMWFAPMVTPTEPWWRQPSIHGGLDPRYPNPASEPVLAAQQDLLDEALAHLEDERPGVTDLYFVAFGGDGNEDVFRKDVLAAQKVMDEHWDTDGRSIVLINNPRTLLDTPIATVTNLKATLNEIGASIDADQDVVMVYLASHGSAGHVFEISLPPLELAQITPAALRSMLDASGIKWRIIVVSACYSGGFIDALKDDHTLVMTAARADRTSFGCGHQSESTYFGEALFQQGLAKSESLLSAFDIAKKRVAERETEARLSPPSDPQLWMGPAIEDKLKELERRGAARRTGRSI